MVVIFVIVFLADSRTSDLTDNRNNSGGNGGPNTGLSSRFDVCGQLMVVTNSVSIPPPLGIVVTVD